VIVPGKSAYRKLAFWTDSQFSVIPFLGTQSVSLVNQELPF